MNSNEQLRPGRQQRSRDEVRSHQRERIFAALEDVMGQKGYAETSVADLIEAAGVSRQTFYQLFTSKQDCFVASYARRQGSLISRIVDQTTGETPMDRFAAFLHVYLTHMDANRNRSLLYLVGVYAAGPEATARRLALQQDFVDGVASLFDARTAQERFHCWTLVAAVSTMVTSALLENRAGAVMELYAPTLAMMRRLMTD